MTVRDGVVQKNGGFSSSPDSAWGVQGPELVYSRCSTAPAEAQFAAAA